MKPTTIGLAAGVAAGITAILWIWRRTQDPPILNSLRRVFSGLYDKTEATLVYNKARYSYQDLLKEKPLPGNPGLRKHVVESILPGLAVYQTLTERFAGDKQHALQVAEQVFHAWSDERFRVLMAPLHFLPLPWPLFRWMFGLRMRDFPSEGWDFQPVDCGERVFGFDTTRCFYLNTLTQYEAPELTALFCQTDDWMAEYMTRSVRFTRTQTLGRGGDRCDFRYSAN